MSINELSYIQFRQVVSVLTSINLLSDYVGSDNRPKWYFEQSGLEDSQRAALTELMNDSPVMPVINGEPVNCPIFINLGDPSGYLPRESGMLHFNSDTGHLTLGIGNPSDHLTTQQIGTLNTFIRRLKNKSEIVARGGSAFSGVSITFEPGEHEIKNTVVEFKDSDGEVIFVADGDVSHWVQSSLPINFAIELNEFVAQTMMTSMEDDSLFNELLGVPAKPAAKAKVEVIQEAHPQWGTW